MLAARASAAALPDPGSGPIAAGQTELARPRRSTIPAVGGAQGRQGLGRSAARSGRPGVSGQLQRPGARRGGRGAGGRSRPRGQALMVEQGKPRGRDQALSQPQVGVQATVDPRDEMPLETKETPAGREADEAATKSAPAQGGSSDGASAEEN